MFTIKNEKTILNLIKYGPLLFVLIISFAITSLVIKHERTVHDLRIKQLEENFIQSNKQRVKEEVNRVYTQIVKHKSQAQELLKERLAHRVNNVYNIVQNIYEQNKTSKSHQEIMALIKDAIRPIRFNNGRGYFFIYYFNGENILNAKYPHIEGTSLWNYQDLKGTYLLQEMKKILQTKKETFYDWYWHKGSSSNQHKKTGFFKKFAPLDMFIGTGEYVDDFEAEIQSRLLDDFKDIRYDNNGYVFVLNTKGVTLAHIRDALIGNNTLEVQNYKGEPFIKNIIAFAQNNQKGFLSYSTPIAPVIKKDDNSKTSYIMYYEPWQWVIGSGFYKDNLYEQIAALKKVVLKAKKEAVKDVIYFSIALTILFMVLSVYISNVIRNIFNKYKQSLEKEYENSLDKEKMLLQQSKMATMGEMIGSIAHQWKQPLSLISMASYMIQSNIDSKKIQTNSDVDESIGHINSAVKNLSQTIDDFRNFFNPNKKKEHYRIQEALEDTLKLIQSQLRNNGIEIIKNVEDLNLYGSKNEMLQTLINLLKNAKEELIKKESSERRLIFIDIRESSYQLIIEIKDNAGGISKDIKEYIFEPYFTTKESAGGTGIGLYICQQIVEHNMKGKISVENVSYEYKDDTYYGAQFVICVPMDSKFSKMM